MNDVLFVRGFDPVDQLPDDRERFVEGHGTGEGLAFDQFHHDVVGSDVVEMADVGVVERRDGSGLAVEAFRELGGAGLDGDVAAEAGVVGFVDFAHAALP